MIHTILNLEADDVEELVGKVDKVDSRDVGPSEVVKLDRVLNAITLYSRSRKFRFCMILLVASSKVSQSAIEKKKAEIYFRKKPETNEVDSEVDGVGELVDKELAVSEEQHTYRP